MSYHYLLVSNHTKCIYLSNEQSMIQPTFINPRPDAYAQGLSYYPFPVNLDRCTGSCNTPNDLSNIVCEIKRKSEQKI